MEGKLLHRIFIGVGFPVVIPPPPLDGQFLAQENNALVLTENNKHIALENN